MPLFSDEEFQQRFIQALGEVSEQDFTLVSEHLNRPTTGPRMSGLGSCGRQQVYSATQTPKTNPKNRIDNWNALLGGLGQQLTAAVLRQMGYTLTSEEQEVSLEDGLITGHLDGELTGLDLEDEVVVWDSKYKNIWGLFGTKQSFGLVTDGLPFASTDIYLQMQTYMLARNRKRAIITASPFDMSTTKQEAAKKKMLPQPAYRLVIDADEEAQRLAVQRGQLVAAAVKLGIPVTPEYDANRNAFPCTYCEWRARCLIDGPTAPFSLPRIPQEWKTPPAVLIAQEAA